jgi:hypothetical protein
MIGLVAGILGDPSLLGLLRAGSDKGRYLQPANCMMSKAVMANDLAMLSIFIRLFLLSSKVFIKKGFSLNYKLSKKRVIHKKFNSAGLCVILRFKDDSYLGLVLL